MSEFSGTERYQLVRRLGAGGMGIVYEVFDRQRGEHVALKTLSRANPGDIYDLKKEFRSLADVRHPNVVSLYDIVNDAGQWFFTMELVERGTDLLSFVRPDLPASNVSTESPKSIAHSEQPLPSCSVTSFVSARL